MKKIERTDDSIQQNPVSVQLGTSEDSAPQQVFSGVLECTPDGFLQSIWGKPKGNFSLEIKITNLHGLRIKDESKLLQVELGTQRNSKIGFCVSENHTTFSVLFDPSQVIDGSVSNILQLQPDGNYKSEYDLDYIVTACDTDKNSSIGSITNTLKVVLHLSSHIAKKYSVSLVPSLTELEFSSKFNSLSGDSEQKAFIEIATLKVSHASKLHCAPSTDISFKIGAAQDKSRNKKVGTFTPLDYTQIIIPKDSETNLPIFHETNPVKPHGDVAAEIDATAAILTDSQSGGYKLSNVYGYNSDNGDLNIVSIPIQIDRRTLKNPEDAKVDINIFVQHNLGGSSSYNKDVISVPLKKNTNLVRLRASASFHDFQGKQINRFFDDPSSPDGMGVIEIAPIPLSENREASVSITFENTAETVENGHEHAGVIISDFSLDNLSAASGNEEDLDRIKTHDEQKVSTLGLFSVNGIATRQSVVLPCSSSSENKTQVSLRYSARNIREITPAKDSKGRYIYSVKINVPFTFKYIVDTNGNLSQLCETNPIRFNNQVQGHWKTGSGSLCIHLEKSMSPEWLCVDFGTSAVVALYGANATNNSLLPINKYRTEKVIPEAYPNADSTQRYDLSESSTDFLPSMVYLNRDNEGEYNKCKEIKDFSKSAIWFSPTTGMVAARLDYQLPSLKLMLGFDYLPDIFSNKVHGNFRYHTYRDGNQLVELKLRDDATTQLTEICKVDVLIKNIYEQLFAYYLKPCIEEVTNQRKTQLHKLILTIPNTFTPENISMLREMVYNMIPTLHYDQIRFVSESDAVACHYLSNETLFNAERKSGTEHLLVFDMGAGTLDLTYLKRERILTNESNRQTITIEGKMGVNKAGHYMDYMIASVIYRLLLQKSNVNTTPADLNEYKNSKSRKNKHKQDNHNQAVSNVPSLGGGLSMPSIVSDKNSPITAPALGGGLESQILGNNLMPSDDDVLSDQTNSTASGNLVERIKRLLALELPADQSLAGSDNELKDYVCHKVKPLLSSSRNTKLPPINIGTDFDVPLTVGDILDDSEFKVYIKETTSKVLDNFRAMFAYENGEMPIDTLIFSGRSTHLLDIRKGVIQHLTNPKNNPQAENCKFADMGTMSYIDCNTGKTARQSEDLSDGLKTAVAKGALSYVSFFGGTNASTHMISRNIYANYGLLWNNANGWHYIELLNRNTIPTIKAKQPTDGVYIDQYLVQKQFNFSKERVGEMMLIQTYSKDPLQEWENHNHEMISVLVSISNCDEYNAFEGDFNLELEVDEHNRFIFRIGGPEVTVNPHVDFMDSALRKSIWPVLFSIKK
jgi:hypothetical protein